MRAAIVIVVMVLLAVTTAFVQEHRSNEAAARLRAMVRTTAAVRRRGAASDGDFKEVAIETLVPGDIVRLVLGDGSRFVIAGVVAGIVMTLVCSRVVGRFLFGVSASDPLTLLGVAPVLSAVALMACGVPAWRAARADPTITLRSE